MHSRTCIYYLHGCNKYDTENVFNDLWFFFQSINVFYKSILCFCLLKKSVTKLGEELCQQELANEKLLFNGRRFRIVMCNLEKQTVPFFYYF